MDRKLALKFDVSPGNIKTLKSGSLTCLYEHGKIRYLRCNDTEIVRTIYIAVRDADWNTAPYHIINESIVQGENGFDVRYTADFRMDEISYSADVTIGAKGNELNISMRGEAMSDFKRNRIGICVLHSVSSVTGKEISITKPSGETYTETFPLVISPHQPVKDIREMRWNAGSAEVKIIFEGDVFETEDQRNWGDSSFKTYSTPLDLPLPAEVRKGDTVHQALTLSVENERENTATINEQKSEVRKPFPRVGFSKTTGNRLSAKQVDQLKQILFDHYRVELDVTGSNWTEELDTAIGEARQLDVLLQLTAFFGEDETQLTHFLDALAGKDDVVYSVLALDKKGSKSGPSYNTFYEEIKRRYPSIKVGYGTNNHFADLNRKLPEDVKFDFVSFGLTPEAHLTDTISTLENLDNLVDIVDTLRTHLGDVDIHVSPITFKTRKPKLINESEEPADFDERQHTEFGAAWVLKALRNFGGISVTLFDATGYKGILNEEHTLGGFASPLYNIFRALKEFQPKFFIVGNNKEQNIVIENEKGDRFNIELDPMFEKFRFYK